MSSTVTTPSSTPYSSITPQSEVRCSRIRVERSLDQGLGADRRLQRPGVDDLVGPLPDSREVLHEPRVGDRLGRALPEDHPLVHAASVQVRADRPLEVVDERVYLLVRLGPVELALRVLDVAVERRDRRVDQLGHHPSLHAAGAYVARTAPVFVP